LRVAVACSGLGHVARGIETWADETAAALRRHTTAVDVELFGGAPVADGQAVACWRRTSPQAQRLSRLCRHIGGWRFGMGSPYEVEQTSFALNLWRRIGRAYDILHVQDPLLAAIFEHARRLRLSRPHVILANGTGESARVLRGFAQLQHLTPDAADAWNAERPPGQLSFTIPNFINLRKFRPADRAEARQRLGLPPDRTIILCCAAIRSRHKRIDVLLREFAEANRASGNRLLLVVAGGQDPETQPLMDMAASMPGDTVRMHVGVPRDQIADFYNAADMFVLASLHELFGIVFLEAMACGLPVICHDTPAFHYVVGPAGHYGDLEREGGISQGIAALLDDAACAELAAHARPHVERHFSPAAVIPQVIEMYKAVASRDQQYP
jgi:glycosyltransferase involved in cell wall biosynthesis